MNTTGKLMLTAVTAALSLATFTGPALAEPADPLEDLMEQCEEDYRETGLIGPKDGLYPNPEDCNSYLKCGKNADGELEFTTMPCPDGLEWNDNKKECDWPGQGTCPAGPSDPTQEDA